MRYPSEKTHIQNEHHKILFAIAIETIRWLCFFFKTMGPYWRYITAYTVSQPCLFPFNQNCFFQILPVEDAWKNCELVKPQPSQFYNGCPVTFFNTGKIQKSNSFKLGLYKWWGRTAYPFWLTTPIQSVLCETWHYCDAKSMMFSILNVFWHMFAQGLQ